MPPPPPLELTLVLAATRDMGIGLNGTLPWTGLKREMAYFARVTKRLPPSSQNNNPSATQINAVIMGRKTWDSIPPRFRPLKGRLNVVISHSSSSSASFSIPPLPNHPHPHPPASSSSPSSFSDPNSNSTITSAKGEDKEKEKAKEKEQNNPIMANSLEQALAHLQHLQHPQQSPATTATTTTTPGTGIGTGTETGIGIGRIFIIGGAQIYSAALQLRETRRILLTRVLSDFECDTRVPLELGDGIDNHSDVDHHVGGDGDGNGDEGRNDGGGNVSGDGAQWKRASQTELDEWVGEKVPEGVQEENGTRYEFQMWER